jgi:hypothetical protein
MAVADTAQTVGQSKNDRVNAMALANTAMAGYQAGKALSDLTKSGMNSVKDLNVSVSITVGSSQSKSETHAKGTEAVASNVVGNNVSITATGADKDSNIHVIGSEIVGTHATTLKADNNVTLESAQSTSEEHSSNSSSGWNAGVAISYGQNGLAFGITAGANKGKGHGDGSTVTQANTHVGSKDGVTTITAGDTTTLAGAQVLGNQVNIDTQNLAIESRQDTAKYDSKQMDMSGQVTVGYGFSASGSYSQSKINADYASVNEQSGIMAGDGGYHINVKDHTDFKGGIITSTQAAEDAGRNQMSTGTLTASNIQNHANYDASGFGIGGGFGINGEGKQGNWAPQGANTNGVVAANQQGKAGTTVNKSVGYASDSDSNASTTVSGINTQNLTITNTAGQNATGTDVDAVKSQVATSTTTDQVQANSGAIANNFDKDAVQSEIDLQVKVTQQFDVTRQQAKTIVNQHIDGLNKDIKALEDAKAAGTITADQDKLLTEKLSERDNWQIGGTIVDSIASGLSGPTSTGAAGILANAAAPQLQYQIGQYFKGTDAEGSTAHILAHTILAAAVAAAGGNDALMAGLAAGGAEAVAPAVANWLYGSNPDVKKDEKGNVIASELTAEQKNTISNIIGLGTAGATGLAGGSVTDVVSSTGLAQTALEDNWLTKPEVTKLAELANEINQNCIVDTSSQHCQELRKEYQALSMMSVERNVYIVSVCSPESYNEATCAQEKAKLNAAIDSFQTGDKPSDSTIALATSMQYIDNLKALALIENQEKFASTSNLLNASWDSVKNYFSSVANSPKNWDELTPEQRKDVLLNAFTDASMIRSMLNQQGVSDNVDSAFAATWGCNFGSQNACDIANSVNIEEPLQNVYTPTTTAERSVYDAATLTAMAVNVLGGAAGGKLLNLLEASSTRALTATEVAELNSLRNEVINKTAPELGLGSSIMGDEPYIAPTHNSTAPFQTHGITLDQVPASVQNQLLNDLKTGGFNNAGDVMESIIESGRTVPVPMQATSDTKLYKLVDASSDYPSPSGTTVYWIDQNQLKLIQAHPELANDILGLPANSQAMQFNVFEIQPKAGTSPTIYQSNIATSTNSNGLTSVGGATQTIVPNRNLWTTPSPTGIQIQVKP